MRILAAMAVGRTRLNAAPRGAQSCPIGNTQRRFVLEPRRGIEEARYLLRTEDDRELPGLVDKRRVLDDGVSLERDPEKEP
jgi:hypothetical protein